MTGAVILLISIFLVAVIRGKYAAKELWFDAKIGFVANGHKTRKAMKLPLFVTRAERAMRRAAKGVQLQNRALNHPVAVWQNVKVVEKPA